MPELTPFQTVGPFFEIALCEQGTLRLGGANAGPRIAIEGIVRDGAGEPMPDALLEIWQADKHGAYQERDDEFRGFGRVATDGMGRYRIETVVPGRAEGLGGVPQAPHLLVNVLARGMLTRLLTRIYFEGEPSNADDAILALVPTARRATLIARRVGDDSYAHDLVLQGAGETVFFDV